MFQSLVGIWVSCNTDREQDLLAIAYEFQSLVGIWVSCNGVAGIVTSGGIVSIPSRDLSQLQPGKVDDSTGKLGFQSLVGIWVSCNLLYYYKKGDSIGEHLVSIPSRDLSQLQHSHLSICSKRFISVSIPSRDLSQLQPFSIRPLLPNIQVSIPSRDLSQLQPAFGWGSDPHARQLFQSLVGIWVSCNLA